MAFNSLEEKNSFNDVDSNCSKSVKMCYEDGDKEPKSYFEKKKQKGKVGSSDKIAKNESSDDDSGSKEEKNIIKQDSVAVEEDEEQDDEETHKEKEREKERQTQSESKIAREVDYIYCDDNNDKEKEKVVGNIFHNVNIESSQNVISKNSDPFPVAEKTQEMVKEFSPRGESPTSEKPMNNSQYTDETMSVALPQPTTEIGYSISTKNFGPNNLISQGQIDSYTARVLAMEQSLGNENRVEQSVTSNKSKDYHQYSESDSSQQRTRSPSVPNTSMLGIPKEHDRRFVMDDATLFGSRRPLSPLMEARRPHCTLNCENCKSVLEERFKHSRSTFIILYEFFMFLPEWS